MFSIVNTVLKRPGIVWIGVLVFGRAIPLAAQDHEVPLVFDDYYRYQEAIVRIDDGMAPFRAFSIYLEQVCKDLRG